MSIRAVVRGTGHSVPKRVLTNDDIAKFVDTSDEWITQRTGIKQRHICGDDEFASDLAVEAAKRALESAGWDPLSLDHIIVATVCSDYQFPSSACMIQKEIGAKNAAAFDVAAACAGFIFGTSVADGLLQSNQGKRVLVIGVDTLSKFLNWNDRSTCVLFGDGAGAVAFEAVENTDHGVLKTITKSDGEGFHNIAMAFGGAQFRPEQEIPADVSRFLTMNGNETYRFAVKALGDACCDVLAAAGLTSDDVDLFVPHQANRRIIDASAERMGLDPEKVFINIDKYGNTSAGSIPIGLDEAVRQGRLKTGDLALTVGFGAGLTWGASLIRW